MTDWKLPWDGGCRCGQVRFRVTAPPLLASACHCSGCQRMTASAFSFSLAVPAKGFAVTDGEAVIGGLHGPTRHFFCPWCMSWMYTRPEGLDEIVNVRATLLDEHGWVVPFVEFWTQEGFPWAETPAVHSFATQPAMADFPALIEDFARRGVRPA